MVQLEARELSCGYRDRLVLRRLSLAVRPGEVLALLGPNGSGKTTLLRALSRLLKPKQGAVYLEDRDLWTMRGADTARRIALTPQTERRDWRLTVEQAVRLGRAPHRGWLLPLTAADKQIVAQALAVVGLSELRERPITELSGGEWRRMVLARAVAQQAEALLLDEPTAGLDLKYQVEVLRLVRSLAVDNRLAVVLALHDLNYASLYADRVALIHRREVVAIGPPAEVFSASLISDTYGIPVTVVLHPVHGTPLIVPLAQ